MTSFQLGFAWTTRVLGFINLGVLTVCVSFMRPRLPPRKSGALIDWKAFREPVWNVFIVGWWLIMWTNYYTFYYVSILFSCIGTQHYLGDPPSSLPQATNPPHTDCLLRHQLPWHELRHSLDPRNRNQRLRPPPSASSSPSSRTASGPSTSSSPSRRSGPSSPSAGWA